MVNDFYIENRIYYHDTDAGGVVYYGKYLEHLEESRNEFCRSRGVDLAEWSKKGVHFPVVHVELAYKSPARYGDTIRITSRVERIGQSSIAFVQEIKRQEVLLVTSKTIWACVGDDFKTKALPQELKQSLA